VLQRSGGGGGGFGARGGGGSGSRSSQPVFRTVYVLATNAPAGDPAPQAVRVKTGISDGAYTEVIDGLKEGDAVITAVKLPQSQTAAAPAGASPFGGTGGRGRR
jgi:hypothetical protein